MSLPPIADLPVPVRRRAHFIIEGRREASRAELEREITEAHPTIGAEGFDDLLELVLRLQAGEVDLEVERAISNERRTDARREARLQRWALQVLHGRWSATRDQLESAIAEQFEKRSDAAEQAEVLELALKLQKTERPKVDVALVPATKIERVIPDETRSSRRKPVVNNGAPRRNEIDPVVRKEIRDYMRSRLEANRKLTRSVLKRAVERKFDLEISKGNWDMTYWGPMRDELGIPKGRRPGRPRKDVPVPAVDDLPEPNPETAECRENPDPPAEPAPPPLEAIGMSRRSIGDGRWSYQTDLVGLTWSEVQELDAVVNEIISRRATAAE